MKKLILFFLLTHNCFSQEVNLFSPKIFKSLPNVRDFSMSRDKNEIYFSIESYRKEYSFIAYIKRLGNTWSKPKVVSFSGVFKDLEPFLSPDGLKLFFASNRNVTSTDVKNDIDIWYVKRSTLNDEWSDPINVGLTINTNKNEFYPSVTNNGDLFFTAEYSDSKGKEDIYVSRFINNKYTKPVALSSAINTEKYEFNAYVSPDEKFIVFTSYGRKDDLGRGDLYLSYKDGKGNWLPAKNLGGRINSKDLDYCPFIDVDTNILYFTSSRSSVPKKMKSKKSLKEIIDNINSLPNGLSRIYSTSLNKK